MNLVCLYVANIPSNPIVGSIRNGTIANIRNALTNSELFIKSAICGAKTNRIREKTPPKTKNILVILLIRFLDCESSTRGRKKEKARGNPNVKTVRRVL